MAIYTKTTDFAAKDSLTLGDPLKRTRGTEVDTEFVNIATAIETLRTAPVIDGSVTLSGTARRILGDFSTSTVSQRVMFQSSVVNQPTYVGVLPNGTSTTSAIHLHSNSDPTNASMLSLLQSNTASTVGSGKNGTGALLPLNFSTSGINRVTIAANGDTAFTSPVAFSSTAAFNADVTLSGTSRRIKGDFTNSTLTDRLTFQSSVTNGVTGIQAAPNGTSTTTTSTLFNNSSMDDCALMQTGITSAIAYLASTTTGTGTYLPMGFNTSGIERARILTDGTFVVGNTVLPNASNTGFAAYGNGRISNSTTSGLANAVFYRNNDGIIVEFIRSGTTAGSIQVTASATSYVTSSDYRLKKNVVPINNALSIVNSLNPVQFQWILNDELSTGFIAHELQSVVSQCVTGTKDEVDTEGNPVYQGIDPSKLIGILTKSIQELSTKLDAALSRISQLEK